MLTSLRFRSSSRTLSSSRFSIREVTDCWVPWFQDAYNFERVSVSFTCPLNSLTTFRSCEETPLLMKSERVSMCSELYSTYEASSRVSCHHCFELHFELANEISDLNFAHCSKILSICSSQCDIRGLQCRILQMFPHTHISASRVCLLLCRTTK